MEEEVRCVAMVTRMRKTYPSVRLFFSRTFYLSKGNMRTVRKHPFPVICFVIGNHPRSLDFHFLVIGLSLQSGSRETDSEMEICVKEVCWEVRSKSALRSPCEEVWEA